MPEQTEMTIEEAVQILGMILELPILVMCKADHVNAETAFYTVVNALPDPKDNVEAGEHE